MAQINSKERNTLRKAVRLLDMRENAGQPGYDQQVERVAAGLREMLVPTEKFKLHLPEEYDFEAHVAFYEIAQDGTYHLFLTIEEPQPVAEPEEGEQQQQAGQPLAVVGG